MKTLDQTMLELGYRPSSGADHFKAGWEAASKEYEEMLVAIGAGGVSRNRITQGKSEPPMGWAYEFNSFGDVWERHVILNRPEGGANPPTKHHGSHRIRNVTPLYATHVQQDDKMPDAARIALDSMDADAAYLLSRVKQGTIPLAEGVSIIRQRIEAAKAAIESPDAGQAQEERMPRSVGEEMESIRWRNALVGLCDTDRIDTPEQAVANVKRRMVRLGTNVSATLVESDLGHIRVGRLPTMNQDEYPGLGAWWVQLRVGSEFDEVLARVYGETPEQAHIRAVALAAQAHQPVRRRRGSRSARD